MHEKTHPNHDSPEMRTLHYRTQSPLERTFSLEVYNLLRSCFAASLALRSHSRVGVAGRLTLEGRSHNLYLEP